MRRPGRGDTGIVDEMAIAFERQFAARKAGRTRHEARDRPPRRGCEQRAGSGRGPSRLPRAHRARPAPSRRAFGPSAAHRRARGCGSAVLQRPAPRRGDGGDPPSRPRGRRLPRPGARSASGTPARRTGSRGTNSTSVTGPCCQVTIPTGRSRPVGELDRAPRPVRGRPVPPRGGTSRQAGRGVGSRGRHRGLAHRVSRLPSTGGLVRLFPDNTSNLSRMGLHGGPVDILRPVQRTQAHLDPHRPGEPAGLRVPAPLWVRREQPGLAAHA